MKLGYIDYLNCYPFYYHMMEEQNISEVEILSATPSELNYLMAEKQLDMSPISTAAYSHIQNDVYILPDFCLSSIGYVHSVVLLSKYKIEELDQKTIGLTKSSLTSMILLKIILHSIYNIDPFYEIMETIKVNTFDAILLIGNDAMVPTTFDHSYTYDLGELWMKLTNKPVVFALFAVQKEFYNNNIDTLHKIISSFNESLSIMKENPKKIIDKAKSKYPDITYDAQKYYELLQFHFNEDLQESALFYFQEAHKAHLLQSVSELNFIPE